MSLVVSELSLHIGWDGQEAVVGMQGLQGMITSVGSGAGGMGQALAMGLGLPVSPAMALMDATRGIKDAFQGAIDTADHMQNSLQQVQNNTGMTDTAMRGLSSVIQTEMAKSTASFDSLSEASFHAANFGFKSASDQAQILDAVMKSATTTGGNVAQTADVISGSLHYYGASASDAARFTETLHQAAQNSNSSLEDFAKSSQLAIGFAAQLGVPINEVAAALAALQRNGMNAAQSQTAINNVFKEIVQPTHAAKAAIDDLAKASGMSGLAKDFSTGGLEARSLSGVLADLQTAFDKAGYSAADAKTATLAIFSAMKGGRAAMDLLGGGAADYKANLDQLGQTMGGTLTPIQDAWAKSQETLATQQGILSNRTQELSAAVGQGLLPFVTDATKGLSAMITPDTITAAKDLGTALGGLASTIVGVKGGSEGLATTLSGLTGAVGALTTVLDTAERGYRRMETSSVMANAAMRESTGQLSDSVGTQIRQLYTKYAETGDQLAQKQAQILSETGHTLDSWSVQQRQTWLDAATAPKTYLEACNTIPPGIADVCSPNAVAAINTMGVATSAAAQTGGQATGDVFGSTFDSAVTGWISKTMDITAQAITAATAGFQGVMGEYAQMHGVSAAQVASATSDMGRLADNARNVKAGMVEAAKDAATAARTALADSKRQEAAGDTAARAAAAAAKHQTAAALSAAKGTEAATDAIFKAMTEAGKATETGGAGIAAATKILFEQLDSVSKAHIPGLTDQWTAWVKAAAAGNPPQAATMRAGLEAELQKLATSGNLQWATYARAALENLQKVSDAAAAHADKVATAADKIADKLDASTLKAQQSVIKNIGVMTQGITQGTQTTGDVVVALMDGLKAATDAHMPAVAAAYQHALTEMQSTTPPALSAIKAEFVNTMSALTRDPNASIAAWATQQRDALDELVADNAAKAAKLLSDKQAADAKILEAEQQKWLALQQTQRAGWAKMLADQHTAAEATVNDMGKLVDSIAQHGAKIPDVINTLMQLSDQAAKAGMTQVQADIQGILAQTAATGVPPPLESIKNTIINELHAAQTGGNVELQALASGALASLQSIEQAQAALAAKTAATTAENTAFKASMEALKDAAAAATATLLPYQQAVAAAGIELDHLKASQDAAKVSLDAATAAVTAAKAEMQGYQGQITAAQTALTAFAHPQLQGMGEFKDKLEQQKIVINDLELKKNLMLQANPHANTTGIDAQIKAAQLQATIWQEQSDKIYGPTLLKLREMTEAQKEITPAEAIAGVLKEQDALKLLQAQLATSQAHVVSTEAAQRNAQRAYAAASEAVKAQEGRIKELNAALAEQQALVKTTIDGYKAQEEQLKTQHDLTLQAIADGTTLTTTIAGQADALTAAVPTVTAASTQIAAAVSTSFAAIPAVVGPALQALGPDTAAALQAVAPAIAPALAPLAPALRTALQAVYPAWDSVFGAVPAGNNLLNRLWGHQEGSWWHAIVAFTRQRVAEWFAVVWVQELDLMATKMAAYLRGLAGAVIAPAGGEIGSALIQGIAAGITTSTHFVEEAAATAVRAAIAAANAAAGNPHSPAPATVPLGQALVEGVGHGVTTGQTGALAAMRTFIGAMVATPVPAAGAAVGPRSATTGLPVATGVPGLGLGALPPAAATGGGGSPITVNITVQGLQGDIQNPETWRTVAIPLSQALAQHGLTLQPNGGI